MTYSDKNTAAVILSGGAGTRLNGADKGLQTYQGKSLIEHVITIIEPQVDSLYICANRNLERYQSFSFPVLTDEHQTYQGPMSGISSALKTSIIDSNADQLLISSCDSPSLPIDLRQRLQSDLYRETALDACVAYDGKRRQNLHCLIRRNAWPSLLSFFDDGGRAMHRWFNQVNTVQTDFSNQAHCFTNINTIEQLRLVNK